MGKKSRTKTIFKFFLKLVVVLLILLVIGVVAAGFWFNEYLQNNDTKVIDNLELLNNGSIQFDNVCLRFWSTFPDACIELTNVMVYDESYGTHRTPLLQAQKAILYLNIKEWRSRELEVDRVEFSDGALNVFRTEEGYSNLRSLLQHNKSEQQGSTQQTSLNTEQLEIALKDMRLNYSDDLRNSYINGLANQLDITLLQTKPTLEVLLDMDLAMDSICFKQKDGSFLKNGTLKGEFHLTNTDAMLLVKPMAVKINDQEFQFQASIFKSKKRPSEFVFTNPKSDYNATLPVLTKKLRRNLSRYDFTGPIDTKTTLYTNFQKGEFPIVTIDFKLKNNGVRVNQYSYKEVTLQGRFINENYNEDGSLMEGKNILICAKNIDAKFGDFLIKADTLTVEDGKNRFSNIKSKAVVTGRAEDISKYLDNDNFFFKKGTFELIADINGRLNNKEQAIINTDATLEIADLKVVYAPSNTAFFIDQLFLEKEAGDAEFRIKSRIPIVNQQYALQGGIKNVEKLLVTNSEKEISSNVSIVADRLGWKDFIDMFGEDGYLNSNDPMTGTEPLINSIVRDDIQKKQSMKETALGINSFFHPNIDIEVGTLSYYNYLNLNNFKTGLYFKGDRTLVLEETSFDIGEGNVILDAQIEMQSGMYSKFDLNLSTESINLQTLLPPFNYFKIELLKNLSELPDDLSLEVKLKGMLHDTLGPIPGSLSGFVSFQSKNDVAFKGRVEFKPTEATNDVNATPEFITKVFIEGDPFLFNDFFKTVDFLFDHGSFDVAFDYKGDVTSVEDLMTKTNVELNIRNTAITYVEANVKFPVKGIFVNLSNDIADVNIELQPKEFLNPVKFDGRVEGLSEIVLGNTGKEALVVASLFSEYINWKNIYQLIPSPEEEEQDSIGWEEAITFNPDLATTIDHTALKSTVNGLLGRFNPTIRVQIDTFNYNEKVQLHNLTTGIIMSEKGTLVLEATGFDFKKSQIQVNAEMSLDKEKETPFSATFFANNLNIAHSLEALDYLGIESFKNSDRLEGLIDLNLELAGAMDDVKGGLITKRTKGVLNFTLSNIEVEGLDILDSVTNRIILRKRFKNLMFAPIVSKLILDGDHITIPVTEIQSNAIHFFVEGNIKTENRSNVWVTIPFANLKRRDLNIIPNKKGYASVREKLFMEITTEENKLKIKFHISKRKYYKDLNLLSLFKEEKKGDRKFRQNNKPVRKLWEIIKKNSQ